MRSSAFSMLILLTIAANDAVLAAPKQLSCPESLRPESVRVVGVAKEWTPFVASPLYLHAAAPMDGPPEGLGDLAEFTKRRSKDSWSYTYRLDIPFPEGKWLQCAYGEYNQVTLSQRLPDDVTSCTFTYRKGEKAGQHDIDIRCE